MEAVSFFDNALFSFFKDYSDAIVPLSLGLLIFVQVFKAIFAKDGPIVRVIALVSGILFSALFITANGARPAGLESWDLYIFWAKIFLFGFLMSGAALLEYWGIKRIGGELSVLNKKGV